MSVPTQNELLARFACAALAGGLEQGVESDMAGLGSHVESWWHPPDKIAKRAFDIAAHMLAEYNRSIR
jgi:hypothetical protein